MTRPEPARLGEVARVADPDPWRNSLARLARSGRQGRRKAAPCRPWPGSAKFDELGAVSLDLLGKRLADAGDPATAETVLRAGAATPSGRRLGQL